MKTELTDCFEGIEFKRVLYTPQDNPKQEFEDYLINTKAVEKEMGFKTRKFEPRQGKPEAILESYGPSKVILEYLCDNFVNWEGGQIITASVRDGAQAQRFLEHCLNNYGGMSGTPFQRRHSFSEIPFELQESGEGRRTLNLVTGAKHPQILWREMYNIFVDEIVESSTIDKPTR